MAAKFALEDTEVATNNIPDPKRCEVKGLKKYLVKDVCVEFNIIVKDASGSQTKDIGGFPNVKVSDFQVTLKGNSNGIYTASFVPTEGGKLKIEVFVITKPIKGSPFVRPCRDYKAIKLPQKVAKTGNKVNQPCAVAVSTIGLWVVSDRKKVYFFDALNRVIRTIECPGTTPVFSPAGMTFNALNDLYIVSTKGCRVQKFSANGEYIMEFQNPFSHPQPEGVKFFPILIAHKKKLYITDPLNKQIVVFYDDGLFYREMKIDSFCPAGLTISSAGHLLITDYIRNSILTLTLEGEHLEKFVKGDTLDPDRPAGPEGIVTDAYGFVIVCSTVLDRVSVYDKDGALVHRFGRTGDEEGEFISPCGLAINPEGKIYVVDYHNFRIQIF